MDLSIGGGGKTSNSKGLQASLLLKKPRSWNFLNHGNERAMCTLRHAELVLASNHRGITSLPQLCDSTEKNCSQFTVSCSLKRAAFTLAEVLITLGIIGVVAAMTLPTLLSRNEEKVTVNKLKKFYSTMSQAYLMSVNDNGYANEWNVDDGYSETTANQLAKYITPYLKITKDCGTQSGCLGYTQDIKKLNGNVHTSHYDTDTTYYKLILADGSYMYFRASSHTQYCKEESGGHTDVCGAIFIDVDGPKNVNTIGKDIFEFKITPKGVFPNIANDCKKTSNGFGCASYILTHDNMDYLH